MGYRGRLLMAVQAEMGDSASDAAIKQVEVEATAPISDVSMPRKYAFLNVFKKILSNQSQISQ